jgi:hypothetical protein
LREAHKQTDRDRERHTTARPIRASIVHFATDPKTCNGSRRMTNVGCAADPKE